MFYNLVNLAVAAGLVAILTRAGVDLGEAMIAGALWGVLYTLADISQQRRRE